MHLDILDRVNSLCRDTKTGSRSTYRENSESSFWLELRMTEEVLNDKPGKRSAGVKLWSGLNGMKGI